MASKQSIDIHLMFWNTILNAIYQFLLAHEYVSASQVFINIAVKAGIKKDDCILFSWNTVENKIFYFTQINFFY